MGIQVEFSQDLALRNIQECADGERDLEECILIDLRSDVIYDFLKEGQRVYPIDKEIPLRETRMGQLSRPVASIRILEATHYWDDRREMVCTKGRYLLVEVFDPNDPTVQFEGYDRRKSST